MTDDSMTTATFNKINFEGFKNSEVINCDTQRLLDYLIFLEWDSSVESYFQPQMSISVDYRNSKYQVEIDLWINYKNGSTEVIQFLDSEWTRLINDHPMLYARLKHFCRESRLQYVPVSTLVTDYEPLRSNLHILWDCAKQEVKTAHLTLLHIFFAEEKKPTLGKLRQVLEENGFSSKLVYTLIFHKLILVDIFLFPLEDQTTILAGYLYLHMENVLPKLFTEKPDSILKSLNFRLTAMNSPD